MKRLPDKFKKYFWDCDFSELNIINHKDYILNRLLAYGDLSVINFIFTTFSLSDISVFLNIKGQKSLSRTNYLFWQKLVKYEKLWKK